MPAGLSILWHLPGRECACLAAQNCPHHRFQVAAEEPRAATRAEFNEEIHSEGCEALNPETVLLQRADTQLLEQAMDHLPDRLREVLVLRELEGLSYKEIAEVVGVPMGTVMSTLFRARERFRHAASDLVRRQAQPKGSSALSDAELQELTQDAVQV